MMIHLARTPVAQIRSNSQKFTKEIFFWKIWHRFEISMGDLGGVEHGFTLKIWVWPCVTTKTCILAYFVLKIYTKDVLQKKLFFKNLDRKRFFSRSRLVIRSPLIMGIPNHYSYSRIRFCMMERSHPPHCKGYFRVGSCEGVRTPGPRFVFIYLLNQR